MPRLPKVEANAQEFVTYTTVMWHNHDAFYAFWVERWKRVIDYLRSLHWRILMEVDQKQIAEWRRFPISNFTLAVFQDMVGQYLQSRVRWSAVPDRPDQIASAELADQVLRYLWDKLGMDEKKIEQAAWLLATGNADLRVFWNTNTGEMLPLGVPDGQGGVIPINPQTMQPDPTMQEPIMLDAGEIGVEVVPPQLVRWGMQQYSGVMVGYLLTYDQAVDKYGDKTADNLSYQTVSGPLTTDLMSVFPQTLSSGMPAKEPAALVMEHYLPRTSRYPNGLWWTAADNKVVVTKPQPLPGKIVPIVHFRWIPLPGHPFLGLSPLYDITWSNKHYEEMEARMLEWLNKVLPKVIRKTGDGLRAGEISTDEPAAEVTVNPGMEPEFTTLPPFPQQFEMMRQTLSDDIMTVAGYKTRRPEQMPAGEVAKNRIRQPPHMRNEGEQVMLAIMNSKASWEKLGYILLDYVGKFYTEPRAMAIVGADKTYQWREFQGSDLANLQATIHVDEMPLYTWNRQSMRDTVLGLLDSQAGSVIFSGPDGQPDRDRIDSAMNAVGIDVAQDAIDPDILEAKNENNMFKGMREDPQSGQMMDQPPNVEGYQNHQAHLEEHGKIPKSLAFKTWSQPKQQAFMQHMSGHEQAISQAQQGQQQSMLQMEQALRQIRDTSEMQKDVKTELGKALVDALVKYMMPSEVKAEATGEGGEKKPPTENKE
jgi:hypothetical protein